MRIPGPRTDLRGKVPHFRGPSTSGMVLLLLAAHMVTTPVGAQTIRPVVVEGQERCTDGRFELVNDGLTPLTVVLEPRSFDVSETGEPIYRPLDPRIHLRLST